MAKVGIVYNTQTLALLMVVVPEFDSELLDPAYLPKGATLLQLNAADYKSGGGKAGAQSFVPGWQA